MRADWKLAVTIAVAATVLAAGAYETLRPAPRPSASPRLVPVVAAENFWGSLVAQIGGEHVRVLSLITDPNADPHEIESTAQGARAIADARLVVINGAGYDDWAAQLLSANAGSTQVTLNVAELLGVAAGVNPHFWYNPDDVRTAARAMHDDLVALDPVDAAYFEQQFVALSTRLSSLDGEIGAIRHAFAGAAVASTESIFVYLANATALDLVSPPEFMDAVAEGTDPSAASVATFEQQLSSGGVGLLVYNLQTQTTLTEQMTQIATDHHVALVGITETVEPADATYETWMGAELSDLESALASSSAGG
ncbi:MAG TPA: zinc ABC transporter substrate-binding protein [Thermoplasmata archaeon]|nr:zinc ABC transporter substrate-binding protein [Thermoplasmata archaeon]